jgi:hypothetical protein
VQAGQWRIREPGIVPNGSFTVKLLGDISESIWPLTDHRLFFECEE